jgi:hypothetical protein
MQTTHRTTTPKRSPVDNETYNLLQSLTSHLEGIETYQKYIADGGESAELFDRLARDEADHASQLLEALQKRLRG